MPDEKPGLTSKDFREQYQVRQLERKANGVPVKDADPYDQIYSDTRKASAIKLMAQQDRSLDVELLKADNDRLKAEIENDELKERRGGPQGTTNPYMDHLSRQLEQTQARLDVYQERAQQAQAAVMEERLRILQEELSRVKVQTPEERDELESALSTVDKALALAERLRPPSREIVDRGPDPGLRRFELTLEADREARKLEAEERRYEQQMDLQLKREALAREEARLDKQAQAQERFFTDTAPKLLQLGQQLVETLAARTGQPAAAAPAIARGETTPAVAAQNGHAKASVIPAGAATMICQVPGCGATIIYRPGWPEVICSSCGALYTNDAPDEADNRAAVAERAEPNAEDDQRSWADAQREETYGAAAKQRADTDPAIPT